MLAMFLVLPVCYLVLLAKSLLKKEGFNSIVDETLHEILALEIENWTYIKHKTKKQQAQ